MGFISPEYLWLLLLLAPLALAGIWSRRRRLAKMEAFAHRDTWRVLAPHASPGRRFHKAVFLYAAFAFSVLAVARPYWGTRERELQRSGLDIMLAVDVSRSMLATDLAPTRLDQARTVVRDVLSRFPGQRVGLMPFAGEPFLQCPLTTDYGLLLDLVRQLRPDVVMTPGTNIAGAIRKGVEAFERAGQGTRILILVTDGEDHSGEAEAAAREAAAKNVVVYTVGLGSAEGSLLRNPDGSIVEDEDGAKVVSRLGIETLASVARLTGGDAYVVQPGASFDARPLIATLADYEKSDFEATRRIVREERFQWPLAIALLFLLLEALFGERRSAAAAQPPKEVPA
ncbi:MAG: VWA domain-containing protein [Candidatus Sumerlaeia bacterium]|nr:VWA domain-containing protein [Candidatus Sumerlaeia bacterium]